MVGVAGFEPTTSRTPSVRATKLRYTPTFLFGLGFGNTSPGSGQPLVLGGGDFFPACALPVLSVQSLEDFWFA